MYSAISFSISGTAYQGTASLKFYYCFHCSDKKFIFAGSNAVTERLCSHVNKIWTSEKSNLSLTRLESMLFIKYDVEMSCTQFYEFILKIDDLLKKIHSSDQYK